MIFRIQTQNSNIIEELGLPTLSRSKHTVDYVSYSGITSQRFTDIKNKIEDTDKYELEVVRMISEEDEKVSYYKIIKLQKKEKNPDEYITVTTISDLNESEELLYGKKENIIKCLMDIDYFNKVMKSRNKPFYSSIKVNIRSKAEGLDIEIRVEVKIHKLKLKLIKLEKITKNKLLKIKKKTTRTLINAIFNKEHYHKYLDRYEAFRLFKNNRTKKIDIQSITNFNNIISTKNIIHKSYYIILNKKYRYIMFYKEFSSHYINIYIYKFDPDNETRIVKRTINRDIHKILESQFKYSTKIKLNSNYLNQNPYINIELNNFLEKEQKTIDTKLIDTWYDTKNKIKELKNNNSEVLNIQFQKKLLTKIRKNKKVTDAYISDENIIFYTIPLRATVTAEDNTILDKYMGVFKVKMSMTKLIDPIILNMAGRKKGYYHAGSYHPHQTGKTNICLGNYSVIQSSLLEQRNYELLVSTFINFLETSNINDIAGKTIKYRDNIYHAPFVTILKKAQ